MLSLREMVEMMAALFAGDMVEMVSLLVGKIVEMMVELMTVHLVE